jgi:hypothetical protein
MSKNLECKLCGVLVRNCRDTTGTVTCAECIQEILEPPPTFVKKSAGFPRGWRFMKVFVHQDGTVYHGGVEQPTLKGTLESTEIKVVSKKDRLEKKREKEDALVQIGTLKKKLKSETKKGEIKKLQSQIKRLQKKL